MEEKICFWKSRTLQLRREFASRSEEATLCGNLLLRNVRKALLPQIDGDPVAAVVKARNPIRRLSNLQRRGTAKRHVEERQQVLHRIELFDRSHQLLAEHRLMHA